jgi:hypothetical protein
VPQVGEADRHVRRDVRDPACRTSSPSGSTWRAYVS